MPRSRTPPASPAAGKASRSSSSLTRGRPEDNLWTGAEIQSCCRLAALLDLPLKEAAKNVVPVAVTVGRKVKPAVEQLNSLE